MKRLLRQICPRLTPQNFRETSRRTPAYNCLAFAAGDQARVWDPRQNAAGTAGFFWPAEAPRENTLDAWAKALATVGFSVCPNESRDDPGLLRVAVYAQGGAPTHAARQLRDGWWASKLGDLEDIEHRQTWDVSGGTYGEVVWVVARPRTEQDP